MRRSTIEVSGIDLCFLSPKVTLRDAPGRGRGLFATQPIAEGETVIVWGGAYGGADLRRRAELAGKATMQWDDELWSVESDDDHPAYAINHSCEPNVWMTGPFSLIAMRPIAAGEEITADYALWEADEESVCGWVCRCGSPRCRGRITGRDWRRPELQARYAGHFSPLILKRIERQTRGRA